MSDNKEPFIRPRTRNVRAARERRIGEFAEVQRSRREWINFCELREWYRNATGRTARDGEEALRAAVEAGDFEGPPGRSRIMYLHPYLRLQMQRRLTRDMLQGAIAADENRVWSDYLACCWISRDDARAWFESQNIEPPAVLRKRVEPAQELPKGGGLAQAELSTPGGNGSPYQERSNAVGRSCGCGRGGARQRWRHNPFQADAVGKALPNSPESVGAAPLRINLNKSDDVKARHPVGTPRSGIVPLDATGCIWMEKTNTTTIPKISLTPAEAAASTGFSRTRIFAEIKAGRLIARGAGKSTVIETPELVRWVQSLPRRRPAPAGDPRQQPS